MSRPMLPAPHPNEMTKMIPLSRPAISEDDIAAVVEVLRTPHLSLGPKVPPLWDPSDAYGLERRIVWRSASAKSKVDFCA